uniref:BPTI/Kunitz inhibitor domain-containing protein n=1 Tax=Seriola lalandi dorsalis TaxID=1841481 RepID=A0A3B4X480_SERLL
MFPRWRYDAAAGVCEQFVFGGCKPNHNNYLSEHECLTACGGVTGELIMSFCPQRRQRGASLSPPQVSPTIHFFLSACS